MSESEPIVAEAKGMTRMNTTRIMLAAWTAVTLTVMAGAAKADESKTNAAAKPTAKALCDDDWEGGFKTIAVDQVKYDGQSKVLKNYDPQHPNEPWHALSTRYLGMNDCCGNVYLLRLFGRFYEKKDADLFLKKLYSSSDFARHLNPRFPPAIFSPGAVLVSDKYACTLDDKNDTLSKASWIVELDGKLYAGGETACKQGKKQKRVSIVACDGKKVLATDTWAAPCDGSAVRSCLVPVDKSTMAVWQDFSASGEGRQTSFRVYDVERGKVVAKFKGGGDWEAGGGWFREFTDRDGDGVPEVIETECDAEQKCKDVRIQKWRNGRFVDAKLP